MHPSSPGDTERDSGKPDRVELVAREAIERAVAPPVAWIVAIDGTFMRNKQVFDRIFITGRAAQTQCMPDIVERGL
jgi:hypothetical protein